jgi:phosphoacetylglucosamine mutase
VNQCKPENLDAPRGTRCCSLDGDADRIVYYFESEGAFVSVVKMIVKCESDGVFGLLDGDRIATLAATYIMELVRDANLTLAGGKEVQVGVVQTAYANGNSGRFLKNVMVGQRTALTLICVDGVSSLLESSCRNWQNWRQELAPQG